MSAAANKKENGEQGISAEKLFALDAPEPIVCLERKGRIFRHVFRRLTPSDALAHFENITEELASDGDGSRRNLSSDVADLVLYRRAIQRVEGYRTRDGREPEKLSGWPECIPVEHRLAAVAALLKNKGHILMNTVRVASDGRNVLFAIVRGGGDTEEAVRHFVVAHNFLAPTAEHTRQFSDALQPTVTSWTTLQKLYDTLIERVEGYSIGGRALSGKDEAAREIPTYHKGFAVTILLSQFPDCDPETLKRMPYAIPAEFSRSRQPAQLTRAEVN